MEDVILLLGGIIPEQDRAALTEMGVAAVFGPGTSTQQIVQFILSHAGPGASL